MKRLLLFALFTASAFCQNATVTVAPGAGAGAGATATVSGTFRSGQVTITPAGTPTNTAILFTVTFTQSGSDPLPAPYVCSVHPQNLASLVQEGMVFTLAPSGSSGFTAFVGGTAVALAAEKWGYVCL